jgi:hypothetical protein
MDVETEIIAFGETVLWVECDICRQVYGWLGVGKAIVNVGGRNICTECAREREAVADLTQLGNLC